MQSSCKEFSIYTDGACSGNPGKGAYCFVIVDNGVVIYKGVDGFIKTTNNRMELMALIEAIRYLRLNYKNFKVLVFSDSNYVVSTFNENWISNWIKTDFKNKKNVGLWKEYLKLVEGLDVKYFWVKGHSGVKFNEECDKSANSFIKIGNLRIDEGYLE